VAKQENARFATTRSRERRRSEGCEEMRKLTLIKRSVVETREVVGCEV
jgi:hypothetical protein